MIQEVNQDLNTQFFIPLSKKLADFNPYFESFDKNKYERFNEIFEGKIRAHFSTLNEINESVKVIFDNAVKIDENKALETARELATQAKNQVELEFSQKQENQSKRLFTCETPNEPINSLTDEDAFNLSSDELFSVDLNSPQPNSPQPNSTDSNSPNPKFVILDSSLQGNKGVIKEKQINLEDNDSGSDSKLKSNKPNSPLNESDTPSKRQKITNLPSQTGLGLESSRRSVLKSNIFRIILLAEFVFIGVGYYVASKPLVILGIGLLVGTLVLKCIDIFKNMKSSRKSNYSEI